MAEERDEAGPTTPEAETPAPEQKAKKAISDEDYLAMFEGPAFASNRMFMTVTQDGVRLAFMEQHGTRVPPQFRTAVALSFANAFALRDLLERQLKNIRAVQMTKEEAEELAKKFAPKPNDGQTS